MTYRTGLTIVDGQTQQPTLGDYALDARFPKWDSTYNWAEFSPAFDALAARCRGYGHGETRTYNHNLTGNSYFSGACLGPNGKIYCIPFGYPNVLVINPNNNDSQTEITTNFTANANLYNGGCLTPGGIIYCPPQDAQNVLKINTNNDTVTTIGSLGAAASKYVSAVYYSGNVYCAPINLNTVLKINTANDNITTVNIGTANGAVPSITIGPDDNLYLIPRDGNAIVKFNTSNDTASTPFTAVSSNSIKWQRGKMGKGGVILCAPLTENTVLMIQPETSNWRQPPTPSTGATKWSGGVTAADGWTYFAPRDSAYVIKINPDDAAINQLGGYGTGVVKWINGCQAENGYIYFPPYITSYILKIKAGPAGLPLDFLLSRYINYN